MTVDCNREEHPAVARLLRCQLSDTCSISQDEKGDEEELMYFRLIPCLFKSDIGIKNRKCGISCDSDIYRKCCINPPTRRTLTSWSPHAVHRRPHLTGLLSIQTRVKGGERPPPPSVGAAAQTEPGAAAQVKLIIRSCFLVIVI